ncbi:Gfo/Idh/MocA family oxidoreductase [Microbulbifer magnicolonia]|uniref:Gfo/Idh/MocA family protein n=1 Tax=Microbulbifer magnicolonia TaxID=3109744 RepID=UPI002B401246|nr:Gfo/Idh/MocA family oxidoreductase [Microbulbifer sp. GG15]
MKVAAIGAGAWGKNIIRSLSELDVLAAVIDLSSEKCAEYTQAYPGIATHGNYREAIAADYDAFVIATPTPLHYEIARAALEADKDVLIEKPMTATSLQAETLVRLAEQRGRILMAGHLLLYQPAIQWIKEFLDAGTLGTLYTVHQERLGLGRARPLENVLWDCGVHDLAVLLLLVGNVPCGIRASGHRIVQPTVEDDVYVHLEFPCGVRASLHNSWLWPETRRRLVVRGSEGMLVYDELAQTVTLHRKGITPDLQNRDDGSEIILRGNGEPLKLELQHFLARVQDRQPPLSDGRSALQVIEVLEQVSHLLES